ncbi:hypothetical protein BD413DRAFT_634248 [Trametes elegans]|nr:hypothetical protein BD413DRAFT_634248 [Trametes elegans]
MLSSLLLTLLAIAVVEAIPLYGGNAEDAKDSAPLGPLAAALCVLPVPLLVAIKFSYVRFRRGQSIHAHPHAISLEKHATSRSVLDVWARLTPYLVGFLGSPQWETKIRARLDRTLRQAKTESRRTSRHSSSPYSPALGDSSRTTANTSTAYYSSLSHKSRSRTKSLSASFGDISTDSQLRFTTHAISAITDCSIIHPSTPPCQHATFLPAPPPPAHTLQTPVRLSRPEHSPTLMQIMEPVLASWYDDSKDESSQDKNDSQDHFTSSVDSPCKLGICECMLSPISDHSVALPFQTPMTSPASPDVAGTLSVPSFSFNLLRTPMRASPTSPSFSLSANTLPSPTTASFAVFHSPAVHSIPVPKAVYTPSLRPESRAVNWPNEFGQFSVQALLQSPTHRSPALGAPSGILTLLAEKQHKPAKVTFSPTLTAPASPAIPQTSGSGPVVLKSALKKRSSGTSPIIPSSLRNSVSFSLMSLEVPAGDSSAASLLSVCSPSTSAGKRRKSWELTDLVSNGQLDVDAVTRVLGLGLGMGLSGLGSRSSVGSVGSAGSANTSAVLSPASGPADEPMDIAEADAEYDVEQYGTGWDSPGLPAGSMSVVHMHVHGRPLCVIPEETRSEVCSVAGSVHVPGGEDAVVSMELDSEIVSDGVAAEARTSDIRDSWREGESVMTLSVGVAW